jgi:carboxymethylenebutenolidase
MGEMIQFPSNGHTCSGYLARPSGGRGPGLVVIQEWWGLVDHIKDVCDRFAAEGFVALAPDLFHGEKASTQEPDKAGKLAMGLKIDEATRDMLGAVAWLAKSEETTGDRVGIAGFCMGGALALHAAAQTPTIAAAVAFYPGMQFLERAAFDVTRVRAPMLGHFASEDHSYTREQVDDLQRRAREGGNEFEVHWYSGADHAFFNDTRPEVHRPEASREAWERTLGFLRKHLATTAAPVS